MKQIWTTEQAEYHGEHVDFDPIYLWPKPVQQPHPPIYLGGESAAALRRLATYGDAWLPRAHTAPEEIGGCGSGWPSRAATACRSPCSRQTPTSGSLAGFVEAGVDEITLMLDTLPEAETLRSLDELTAVAAAHR